MSSNVTNILVPYFPKCDEWGQHRSIAQFETELNPSDFELAQKVRSIPTRLDDLSPGGTDPITSSTEYFEGDINLKGKRIGQITGSGPLSDILRNAVRAAHRKWPGGRIPYTISSVYSAKERGLIASAMSEYHAHTCIRFEAKTDKDSDYVFIMKDDGCYSEVGRGGGRQILSLDDGCVYKGIVLHEFMHAAGFFHEQSRTDRDEYIDIKWRNIIPGADGQFQKYSRRTIDDLGFSYDYASIMHYGPTSFTRNGRPTIVPKKAGAKIGQRKGFSQMDIDKLNKLYRCSSTTTSPPTTRPPERITKPSLLTQAPRTRPTKAPRCADKRSDCTLLKYACENDKLIQQACEETCGFCDKKQACAGDDNSKCQTWATRGYCKRGFLQSFMERHCCSSCDKQP